jgi:hypothetical protein
MIQKSSTGKSIPEEYWTNPEGGILAESERNPGGILEESWRIPGEFIGIHLGHFAYPDSCPLNGLFGIAAFLSPSQS